MRHIKAVKNWRERQTEYKGEDPLLCKICQKTMVFVSNHLPVPLLQSRVNYSLFFMILIDLQESSVLFLSFDYLFSNINNLKN